MRGRQHRIDLGAKQLDSTASRSMAGTGVPDGDAAELKAAAAEPETAGRQGNVNRGQDNEDSCRRGEDLYLAGNGVPWGYVNLHYRRATTFRDQVEALDEGIKCFVHTTVQHKKDGHGVKSKEVPTVSGLVFLQGDTQRLQQFLKEHFEGVRLAFDRATGRPAVISDAQMRPFMAIAGNDPTRVRVLEHSIEHYAAGNVKLRVLTGPLAGQEGYLVRMARDRKLVMAIGGMTVAIGNVHKEEFEPVEQSGE